MDVLVYWVSANVLIKDISRHVERVYSARYARGYYNRSLLHRVLMLPGLLRPVFTGMLISSGERSESWSQKDIVGLLNQATQYKASSDNGKSIFTILLFGSWLGFVLYFKMTGF